MSIHQEYRISILVPGLVYDTLSFVSLLFVVLFVWFLFLLFSIEYYIVISLISTLVLPTHDIREIYMF